MTRAHFHRSAKRAEFMGDKARKLAIAKVHIARQQLGMDDDAYRDLLERITTHRSSAHCSVEQLGLVIDEMKRLGFEDKPRSPTRAGDRRLAGGEQQGKIRALWLSLFHLGEVRDPKEAALAAWVQRVTGISDLAWLDAKAGNQAVEGLKSWCARAGFTVPETGEDGGLGARRALVRAQWAKLGQAEALRIPNEFALSQWCSTHVATCNCGVDQLEAGQLDEAIERLGSWLRQVLRRKAEREGGESA